MHTFYKKPMTNKATLKAGTAYPESQLRAIMVEEVLRRLRNCSPDSSWEEKGLHLTEFANSMKCSGHSEKFRCVVFGKAVSRYKKELENHKQGIEDMYRSRKERERQTRAKGGKASKDTWFKTKKNRMKNDNVSEMETTSVLKVPFTRGVLSGRIKETLRISTTPERICTRVQEGGGNKLRDQIIKPDPFPKDKCHRPDCRTVKRGGDDKCKETCFQGNINYSITCDACEALRDKGDSIVQHMYIGETSRGSYQRFRGHLEQYKNKKGFMWKHAEDEHDGDMNIKFTIRREAVDPDPMRRVLRESIRIVNSEENSRIKLMNTKEEYFGVKTIRATFSQE